MRISVFVLLSALLIPSANADTGAKREVKPQITLETLIKDSKATIDTCQLSTELLLQSYLLENKARMNEIEANVLIDASQKNIHLSPSEVRVEVQKRFGNMEPIPTPKPGPGCTSDSRQDIISKSKQVAKAKAKIGDKIRDMTAQWLTVMDAIGKSNFNQEKSKFETLANRLLLE